MNKEDALKLALEALENGMKFVWTDPEREAGFVAIDAIKEALAQQEQEQEPVAAYTCGVCGVSMQMERPWVGLTDDEVKDAFVEWGKADDASFTAFVQFIEAKLKEKNT